jgi:hypothetical protein
MGETVGRRFFRRGPAEILLAAEALLLLTFFRVCLVLVPVYTIIRTITRGPAVEQASGDPVDEENETAGKSDAQLAAEAPSVEIARRVRWAVEAVSRHSPIAFVCFPQTLAGYTMLRRRRVQSTMVYGVARSPVNKLTAHTWLMVGDKVVLGGEGSAQFTPVERWG